MTHRLAVFITLLALAALRAGGEESSLPTADQIVDRHAQARGGYERIRSLRSVIYRGLYRENDPAPHDAAMALMRPYYKLVGDPERPSREFSEGYDGSAWEFYGDPGVVVRTVGPAAAAARHGLPIEGPLVDYREKGSRLTVEGIESVAGRRSYRLRLRMADGFEEEDLIDAETWLWTASRKVAPIHAFGADVRTETRFGDYRPVEGVLFPHVSGEVEIATGRVLNEMRWTSITVNRDLDPAVFSPPVFERTPLQRLLEHLYAERSDVEAVLWTYRDFRRAHPGVDTDAGTQFIGYQMLKMGDHAAATALLEANVAAYPDSSGAAFGLGRAYRTAGRPAEARAAFQRALRLDPNNARAREALRALSR